MSTHPAIARLRAAERPVAPRQDAAALFERIVATPTDARLARPRRPRRLPRVALAAGVGLLAAGAAWAATSSDALHLFQQNAQDDGRPGSLWHQTVIPRSVIRAARVRIPGAGVATFWYADTRQHGWCAALRLPTGAWAGTTGSEGGTVPGCFPTRSQVNSQGAVYMLTGFDYQEGDLTVDGRLWRIYYGRVDGKRPAMRVVDRHTRRSVPVHRGHLFALAVPSSPDRNALHLEAFDGRGRVVADERHALR
jgi:hypothetical protein